MAIKTLFSSTGSWAKRAALVAMFGAMSSLLVSCGGSGTASTTPTVPPTPPVITLGVLPTSADVFPGLSVDFTITGGTSPYTTGTSNAVVLPAPAVTGSSTTTFKISILANSVIADTSVTITIRDSLGATTPLTLNVRATTLNNIVTITPVAPTGTGCSGICSGGDAQVDVTAQLNGLKLTNRPIRFDVSQGDFRFVTPGTNTQVNSIVVNTDENGVARVRLQTLVAAPTQVAIFTTTDTVTGLVRRTNFVIQQQTSGVGILSVLPSGTTTFTAFKAAVGQPAQCPFGGIVDMYIYGGTPPYTVVAPLPQFLSVFPSIVTTNGGSYRVTLSGCGNSQLIVTDAQNRVIESAQVVGVAGPAGDAPPAATPPSLAVSPVALTIGCGQTGSVSLSGFGNFTAVIASAGVPPASAGPPAVPAGLTVTPTSGAIPGTVSFTRNSGNAGASPATIIVNIVGATVVPVTLTVPPICP